MSSPRHVLARYAPALDALTWVRVGGGFSGADVFRGDRDGTPEFALKAWPADAARVARIHAWLRLASNLPFVPPILPTHAGGTFVVEGERVWDVARWMPGAAREPATEADVRAACSAVARLHAAWPVEAFAPCPGVLARLRALSDFRTHFPRRPNFHTTLAPLLRRGWDAVARIAPAAERSLRSWEVVPVPLRPCVRDLRGPHVLFAGGDVTGVIDFGAMAVDHPAVDLARLLGDLAGDDDSLFAAGLNAYRAAGGAAFPDELAQLLDRTGVAGSVVGWLLRLVPGGREPGDPVAVAGRLDRLLARLDRFDHI